MTITDQRMSQVPELLKKSGIISRMSEFHEATGISSQHCSNVRNQSNYGRTYHFSAEHIRLVCELYSINANWLIGIEDNWQRSKCTKKAQILELN